MNQRTTSGSSLIAHQTIFARAGRTAPGFATTYQTFERTLTLRQRSKSAIQNYGLSIAKVALHFGMDHYLL
ncbi:MAG: hypothetical protein IH598_10490 [Bacteroidales bacterium]|nr:hypothetical protein [Bacteroidales bacterium]